MTDVGESSLLFRCTTDGIYPKSLYIMKFHPVPPIWLFIWTSNAVIFDPNSFSNSASLQFSSFVVSSPFTSSIQKIIFFTAFNRMVFFIQSMGFVLHRNPQWGIYTNNPPRAEHLCHVLVEYFDKLPTKINCPYVMEIHPHISNGWTPYIPEALFAHVCFHIQGVTKYAPPPQRKKTWGGIPDAVTL